MQIGGVVLYSERQELRDIYGHQDSLRTKGTSRRTLRECESCRRLPGIIAEGFGIQYVNGSAEFAGKYPLSARTHQILCRAVPAPRRFGHIARRHEVPAGRNGARRGPGGVV